MNDFELKQKLAAAPVPERPEEYWQDFPGRVRRQLPRQPGAAAPERTWLFRPAWAGGVALALALVFAGVHYRPLPKAAAAINQHEKQLYAQLERLDAGLHRLMLNTDGVGYLLAEAE
jgi:hypothetical protein